MARIQETSFEKELVQRYGIDGAKRLLEKAQTDADTRMRVMDEYQYFLANFVKENASSLIGKVPAPPAGALKIEKPRDFREEITEGLASLQKQVQSFEPLPPQGYGELQPRVKENLARFENQKKYWSWIKKAKSDFIEKYGPTRFYIATGTRATDWDRWEKGMHEYFDSGSLINMTEGVDRLLNWGDELLGKFNKLLSKAGINVAELWAEGASRFPEEDIPHSEVGAGLSHLSDIQVEKEPVNIAQGRTQESPSPEKKIVPKQTIDLQGNFVNKRPRARK